MYGYVGALHLRLSSSPRLGLRLWLYLCMRVRLWSCMCCHEGALCDHAGCGVAESFGLALDVHRNVASCLQVIIAELM